MPRSYTCGDDQWAGSSVPIGEANEPDCGGPRGLTGVTWRTAWAGNQARLTGDERRAVHPRRLPASMFASVGQMSANVTSRRWAGRSSRRDGRVGDAASGARMAAGVLQRRCRQASGRTVETCGTVGHRDARACRMGLDLSGSVSRYCLRHGAPGRRRPTGIHARR